MSKLPKQLSKTAWKKGESGNPGGRPKDTFRVAEECRKHAEDVVRRLVDWLHHPDPRASIPAAKLLLERGFGLAPATIELSGNVTLDVDVPPRETREEWLARRARELAR
ncbi:MAG: hypothetical protein E6Q97_00750 [Desulfurellales bacterium]|nr:MAG: hypothetical protein E6Q97_00750 [Desulfurellales bacterium]